MGRTANKKVPTVTWSCFCNCMAESGRATVLWEHLQLQETAFEIISMKHLVFELEASHNKRDLESDLDLHL